MTALTHACLIGEQACLSAEYLLTQEANPNGTEQVNGICFVFVGIIHDALVIAT